MTAILGGGLGGLSAAYYCLENTKFRSVVLYEASNQVGGWIKSIARPNGVVFEKGPRTVRLGNVAADNTLQLIDKLNLHDKIIPIPSTRGVASNKLIYANNKLHVLPNRINLFKILEPLSQRLISIIWHEIKTKPELKDDDSMYNFAERRFGKEMAEFLVSPMICGICAGNAKEITVKAFMKEVFEKEQKYGSATKGFFLEFIKKKFSKNDQSKSKEKNQELINKAKAEKWSVWTLDGGLEQLPIALKNNIISKPQTKINTKTKCEQITFKPGVVELLINGKVEKYCKVISCLSAKNLAPLLERQYPQLSRELDRIPFVTVAVINLRYSKNILPMEAFGLLVPPNQNLPILGIIFDSCIHKNDSNSLVTVMMGGAWFDKYFGPNVTNEELLSTAVNQTKNILNTKEDPIEYDVAVLKDCIPQYTIGHYERMQRIKNFISAHNLPLALCGSSYDGVGVNDVILSAKKAVSQIA